MQRNTLRAIVRTLFHLFSHVEVIGLGSIPSKGGCIVATNHLSRLDPALVFALVERADIRALVADKYRKNPLMNWLVKTANGIWVNREDADLQAMRTARSYLLAGGMLGIAPEGTRSRTGGLLQAKTGVAYLADKTAVPVIPAAIFGTETAVGQLLRLRRPLIHIQFGEPFSLPPIARQGRDLVLQENTTEIMCRIAAMLPPQYHGVYAHHPRLRALLSGDRTPAYSRVQPQGVHPT